VTAVVAVAVGVLAALAVLWLAGALALSLASVRDARSPTAPAADLAAGVALLATLGMATIVAGGRIHPAGFYGVVAALVAAVAVRKVRRVRGGGGFGVRATRSAPATSGARAVLGAVAVVLALIAVAALTDRLVWDGWAFWTFKARALYLEGTMPAVLLDPDGPYPWTNPGYPLALPLVQWWAFHHAGGATPAAASFAGAMWLVFPPLLLWRGLRERAGELPAAAAALGAAAFWPLSLYAIGGTAEILMAVSCLGVVIELERGPGRSPGGVARIAVFLTLAALAKNEGLALALVGAVVTALSAPGRRQSFLWLLAPFVALSPWFLSTRSQGAGSPHLGELPALLEMLARLPTLMAGLVDLAATRAWIGVSALLVVTLVAIAASWIRARRAVGTTGSVGPAGEAGGAGEAVWAGRGRAAWAFVAGYLAMVMAVYIATPLELDWLLETSLERVMSVMVPAVAYLCLLSLAPLWSPVSAPGGLSQGTVGASASTRSP
jgi:hypothetical protein